MPGKIYLKTSKQLTSIKDVIQELYNNPRYKGWAQYTYSDADCTELQSIGYRRSFEDLLALVNTYCPNTTELDLMRELISLDMRYNFCNDIHKIVFTTPTSGCLFITNGTITDIPEEWTVKGSYTSKQLSELINYVTK